MSRLRISLAFLHKKLRNPFNRRADLIIGAKTLAKAYELRYPMVRTRTDE